MFKAWLVILGNTQVEGLDYNEAFASVAKMIIVRTLLSIAAARKWKIHQIDFTMPSFTVTYKRRYVWNYHLDFLRAMKEKPANSGTPCMVLNRLPGTCLQLVQCWFRQSYSYYSLFTYSSSSIFSLSWFMWMTLLLSETILLQFKVQSPTWALGFIWRI